MSSRLVSSNQQGINRRLGEIVRRHQSTSFSRPFAPHTVKTFAEAEDFIRARCNPIILDSGCGRGDSSLCLAQQYPDHTVIGVDRSDSRLSKTTTAVPPENLLLLRSDLLDFYRLAARAKWQLAQHTIFYPNPYPKAAQLSHRWHGSPVFKDMLALGGTMELRTNWQIYADEFILALAQYNISAALTQISPDAPPLSLFEKKYQDSNQILYKVTAKISVPPQNLL